MPTECTPRLFAFEEVEGKSVVADFDGGEITSNAGALLLGQVDRGVSVVKRFAACFTDRRDPRFVEHQVETLVGQRIFALALGYEDLNDHDELRKDPSLAVLAGKLKPVWRSECTARLTVPRSNSWTALPGAPGPAQPSATSRSAPCWFATIRAGATPSRSCLRAMSGRGNPIPVCRRSRAPSPAPPGAARASSP